MTLVYLKGEKKPRRTGEAMRHLERRLFQPVPRITLTLDGEHRSLHPDDIRDLKEAT